MNVSTDELRRWIESRRAAEQREREELRQAPLPPAEAVRQALSLIAFASRVHGWPPPEDEVSLREDRLMYESWAMLRARWPR